MKTLHAMAAGFALLASPCYAAITLQPGEWQTTETGTENGKAVPPKVEKECMTAEETRDATSLVNQMKNEMTGQGAQCQKTDIKQGGDSVAYTLKCGMQQFVFEIAGSFTFLSPTRYSGRMKSEVTLAGQKTTSDKAIAAVRVGECTPGVGKKK